MSVEIVYVVALVLFVFLMLAILNGVLLQERLDKVIKERNDLLRRRSDPIPDDSYTRKRIKIDFDLTPVVIKIKKNVKKIPETIYALTQRK